ncbi:hypothetical protein AB6N01_16805 [Alcaligenes nematophilus]|uniref:hypothetical protein n=1 Tax=Alcaligenes nematophilus TaxID=2994643 RepID=UPI0034E09909
MSTGQLASVDQYCPQSIESACESAGGNTGRIGKRSWQLCAIAESAYYALDIQIERNGVASRQRYGAFLRVLYLLHRDLDAVYGRSDLQALVTDIPQRRQLLKLEYALSTLGFRVPGVESPRLSANTTCAIAMGWLFVGEATNLYATILYRLIQRRESRQGHGSCRLLQGPLFDTHEVIDRRWRSLIRALDDALLSPQQEKELFAGTTDAMQQLRRYVEAELR